MMRMHPDRYAVIRIDDGFVVYLGHSLQGCAVAMEPGTVYGKGFTKEEALALARIQLARYSNIGVD